MPNFGVQLIEPGRERVPARIAKCFDGFRHAAIMIEVAQAPPVSVRQNTFAMRAQRQQANRALVRIANASS
jgi:hypothetical protein